MTNVRYVATRFVESRVEFQAAILGLLNMAVILNMISLSTDQLGGINIAVGAWLVFFERFVGRPTDIRTLDRFLIKRDKFVADKAILKHGNQDQLF